MRTAFSLVELSIVLVILGLLTGGILTGQNLIRAAELRSITTEYSNYQTALSTFRDKYFAIPGDMTNATDFWGASAGNGSSASCWPSSAAGTGTQTCNGDGDGLIQNITNEGVLFWEHLANAGLIEGNYSGVRYTTFPSVVLGDNVPSSKFSSAGWWTHSTGIGANFEEFDVDYGNPLGFGTPDAPSGSPWAPALTTEEAWNIDTKIDDGKPGRGKVIARNWDECSLATSFSDLDADYDLVTTGIRCGFFFVKSF